MKLSRKVAAALLASATIAGTAGAQSYRVAGTVQGCFYIFGGPVCSPGASDNIGGGAVTYTAGGFDVLTSPAGSQITVVGIGGAGQNFGTVSASDISFTVAANTRLLLAFTIASPTFPVAQPILREYSVAGSLTAGVPAAGGITFQRLGMNNVYTGPFTGGEEYDGMGNPTGVLSDGTVIEFSRDNRSVTNGNTTDLTGFVQLQGPAVVPEPGSVALLATGLAGLGLAGWRRRRTA